MTEISFLRKVDDSRVQLIVFGSSFVLTRDQLEEIADGINDYLYPEGIISADEIPPPVVYTGKKRGRPRKKRQYTKRSEKWNQTPTELTIEE